MRFEKYRHILVSVTASALLAAGLVSFVPTSEAQITPAPVVVASADHSNTYRETRTPASRGEARKPLEKNLAPVAKVEKKKAQKPAPAPAKPKPARSPTHPGLLATGKGLARTFAQQRSVSHVTNRGMLAFGWRRIPILLPLARSNSLTAPGEHLPSERV
jgi:hypothetical protein